MFCTVVVKCSAWCMPGLSRRLKGREFKLKFNTFYHDVRFLVIIIWFHQSKFISGAKYQCIAYKTCIASTQQTGTKKNIAADRSVQFHKVVE